MHLPHEVALRYRNAQVKQCSPAELVLLLFDGAIRFSSEAEAAMEKGDRARSGERIGRCIAILEQLEGGLDRSHAPELCDNLAALYTFCRSRLLAANLTQDRAALEEIRRVLRPVRDGWAEILGKG
ncbi:MAG: flagellar export chaperone FliS [Labilithrix sp.]|nr:flagellar export chaperone FliS [Labilithrix sp.]